MKLTRPKLQAWLDKMPPRGRVCPSDSCRCILAQHVGGRMRGFHLVKRETDTRFSDVPPWAVKYQLHAIESASHKKDRKITWALAARILRELPR